mmetsp:Transcript_680/g.1131  ORF Transcript_680/g.1131 Transcript_680/m.1131 type:complete len:219 (+) Transcript_680:68-724(+)
MSAFAKGNYCKCGEIILGSPVYCKHCGEKLQDISNLEKTDQMTEITKAVRDVTNAASDEKRDKKYNQQKWGLFETNYQREKGITTEESLQEIEAFSRDGTIPEGEIKIKQATVGGEFRNDLDKVVRDKEDKKKTSFIKRISKRLSSRGKSSAESSASGGSSSPGQRGVAGEKFAAEASNTGKNEFASKFGQGGGAGAAFFSQHQEKEKKKYMPMKNLE